MSAFLGFWIASVSVDDLRSWRVLLRGFLKVCLLISGSIMLYLVVDAQGVLNVQPDRTKLELDGETRELVRVFCAEDIVRIRTHDV